ncbi:MAG: hypothetical protein P8H59_00430 [Flavobacteriales bacterium]|nr:hypothetical protein [Flavobacteriales bacterium]MDG1779388.1 hypothetical protein [Flavobacteriales bacterium]
MMRSTLLVITLLVTGTTCFSQTPLDRKDNKGRFFAFWGWNRGYYTDSDIQFTGEDYDFTLSNVAANDRPSEFGLTPYFNPGLITIPQTNFRIGYFFNEKWSVSLGDDHMKYVMVQDQLSTIDGYILPKDTQFGGTYEGEEIRLNKSFLIFEHTDGLNYVNAELRRHHELFNYKNFNKVTVNVFAGGGIGFMLPKTNATLMDNERHDDFHLAGWGTSALVGFDVTFWQVFFVQLTSKGGFINMPDIRTTADPSDRASQHFWYFQPNFVFGAKFGFGKVPETDGVY